MIFGIRIYKLVTAGVIALISMACGNAWSGVVGTTFSYQGHLDKLGHPANGSFDLEFALYVDPTGGSAVATRTLDDISVANGLVNVMLDFSDAPFNGQALWVELRARDGSATGAYATLHPRQPLSVAPYALHALRGAGPSTLTLPYFGTVEDAGAALLVINNGQALALRGDSAGLDGVVGTSSHPGGRGVHGNAIGQGPLSAGVYGLNDQGPGVWGVNYSSIEGSGIGVFGESTDPNGAGVKGIGHGSNAAGVYGYNTRGAGVWGTALGGGGSGVYGHSVDGAGVRGVGATAMRADGDAVQALGSGGWVKAMVVVNDDGSIARCFNSQATGALRNSQGCGIGVTHVATGLFDLEFPFDLSGSFPVVTTERCVASVSLGADDTEVIPDTHLVRVVIVAEFSEDTRFTLVIL